jgi:hypothetical protein
VKFTEAMDNDFIRYEGHEVFFKQLNNPKVIFDFIDIVKSDRRRKKSYILNFKEVEKAAFPNVCTPLVGILEELSTNGVEFEYYYLSDYLKKIFKHPPKFTPLKNQVMLDRVWKFESSEDIHLLINALVTAISEVAVCKNGVLQGFDWSLNEVMDNVLQHSTKTYGYVMAQVHKQSKRIAICVYDAGQGIYNSLKNSPHRPSTPLEALQICVKEGITRDKKIGLGNGLWGLHQIVYENTGSLMISANAASYQLRGTRVYTQENLPTLSASNGGTIVDFQLSYDKEISVSNALGGHQPTNYQVEELQDDLGNLIYKLADKPSGTGTRQSGQKIRNELINLYQQTQQSIILDFSDVNVSSSFADELVGKLVLEFGFYAFNNVFKLWKMNETVQAIVQRSVAQRMSENLQK